MATEIYKSETIRLIDGTSLYLTPLKIKYLRQFMSEFDTVKSAVSEDDIMSALSRCILIAMQQYCPRINTIDDLEDSVNLPTIYRILNISAGIKLGTEVDDSEPEKPSSNNDDKSSWETLDLAKLESEVFLLGIWKDYEELEISLSMPELIATLSAKRELDHQEKKFLAAIQGVDLDDADEEDSPQKKWEDMKARVFSGGTATNSNDVVSLQGVNAQKAGFGIGMGLSYENLVEK
jgi:translation initiation factor 1 (eIF-1/SUI1)